MRNKITLFFHFIFLALLLMPIAELHRRSDVWQIVQNIPSQITNLWYVAVVLLFGFCYFFYTVKNFTKNERSKLFLLENITFFATIVFYGAIFFAKGIKTEIVMAELVFMIVYAILVMSLLDLIFSRIYNGFDKIIKLRSGK